MSTAVMNRVQEQLAFLGLDGAALQAQSADVEIDRFDYWNGLTSDSVRACHCTATFRSDPLDERAA
jgi:hypothetical protein